MNAITFEQLPQAFSNLFKKVENIERLLQQKIAPEEKDDEVFDVQQTASFLGLSVPTIYTLNSKGELPSMKRSKKLYFLKNDLINYLKEGRRKSSAEIEAEAQNFTCKRGRK